MKKFLFIPFIVFSLYSCKNKDKDYSEVKTDLVAEEIEQEHPGKKLMETQCYICHSPDAAMDSGRLAPPMAAIKAHYSEVSDSKEDFIQKIQSFLEKPEAAKSQMPGAIDKFGLMPYQKFSEEDIAKIGDYIYDNKIEEPDWFQSHWNNRGRGKGNRRRNMNP